MTVADVIGAALSQIPSVRQETAVFLGMESGRARVRVGGNEIVLPFVGVYPPAAGAAVQVEWRDGRGLVVGPTQPRSSLGVVTAVEPPNVTVEIGGVLFTMRHLRSYSPSVGDNVVVQWGEDGGTCLGTTDAPPPPPPPPPQPVQPPTTTPQPFEVTVRATDSGRFQSSWWGNDPWASSSNRGAWVYGDRIRDAMRGAASYHSLEVFLPMISEVGRCQIGIAHLGGIGGGSPHITDLIELPLGRRNGWVGVPHTWLDQLKDGGRGIGVLAPGGAGWTKWRGTRADAASGQLLIRGTR